MLNSSGSAARGNVGAETSQQASLTYPQPPYFTVVLVSPQNTTNNRPILPNTGNNRPILPDTGNNRPILPDTTNRPTNSSKDMSIISAFEENLIREVQKRPFLYDTNCRDYRDKNKKERAWNTISQICHESVTICKIRWKSLRDKYTKELNGRVKRTGSSAPTPRAQRLLLLLSFLKDHDHNNQHSSGNIPTQDAIHDVRTLEESEFYATQDGTTEGVATQGSDEQSKNQEAGPSDEHNTESNRQHPSSRATNSDLLLECEDVPGCMTEMVNDNGCYEQLIENGPIQSSGSRKRTADMSGMNNQLLDVLNVCAQNISTIFQERKKQKSSPSEPFLMSLAPMLDEMSVCQRLQVQIDIMKCIQEILKNK